MIKTETGNVIKYIFLFPSSAAETQFKRRGIDASNSVVKTRPFSDRRRFHACKALFTKATRLRVCFFRMHFDTAAHCCHLG